MSIQGGAQARHRTSSSRVVPAIPLALDRRSRHSAEQNRLAQNVTLPQEQANASQPEPEAPNGGVHGSKTAPQAAPASSSTALKEEPTQAGSESSQTDATTSTQTNGISSKTTSQPQSATSTSFASQILETVPQLPAETSRVPYDVRPYSPSSVSQSGSSANGTKMLSDVRHVAAPQASAPPFVPNGHGYHSSEPYIGPIYPPPFMHGPIEYPQSISIPRGPPGPPAPHIHQYRARQAEENGSRPLPSHGSQLSQGGDPAMTPAEMRPGVMTSAHGPLVEAPFSYRPQHSVHRQSISLNGAVSTPDPKMAFIAAAYIFDQFGSADFADYILLISHTKAQFTSINLPVHGVMMARSPKFRTLLKQSGTLINPKPSLKEITVTITDAFLTDGNALVKAISRLYSGMLPEPSYLVEGIGLRTPRDCMKYALSYAAAGHFLQIDEIIRCGIDLATHFLSLDTIESALAFAIDGGIGMAWQLHDDPKQESTSMESTLEDRPDGKITGPAGSTYGIYSDEVLESIFRCLLETMSLHFKFDSNASQLSSCPRLPVDSERQHQRLNSRVFHIRFGEMTLSEEPTFDPASQLLSSVLLTLPYQILKRLLEHDTLARKLGHGFVADLMRVTVAERESRRKSALGHLDINALSAISDAAILKNMQWAESVEASQQHPSGYRLSRRQQDTAAPPSTTS